MLDGEHHAHRAAQRSAPEREPRKLKLVGDRECVGGRLADAVAAGNVGATALAHPAWIDQHARELVRERVYVAGLLPERPVERHARHHDQREATSDDVVVHAHAVATQVGHRAERTGAM